MFTAALGQAVIYVHQFLKQKQEEEIAEYLEQVAAFLKMSKQASLVGVQQVATPSTPFPLLNPSPPHYIVLFLLAILYYNCFRAFVEAFGLEVRRRVSEKRYMDFVLRETREKEGNRALGVRFFS